MAKKVTLTRQQQEVIRALQISLEGATNCGLLDLLAAYAHPDCINAVCDAVNELEKDSLDGP
ncbi:hypothetical protein [Bradyrhizobium sp. SZCCHNRI2010]|uniref:hypothetical protein n=1 Tax=Bradyrhizobium sp. SZCCHNRI2010 TaxID=3057283 RepID=UPI0028E67786|nr:hypothetical protein [Bradyrhizobium sp. SZCCHNRI2010]